MIGETRSSPAEPTNRWDRSQRIKLRPYLLHLPLLEARRPSWFQRDLEAQTARRHRRERDISYTGHVSTPNESCVSTGFQLPGGYVGPMEAIDYGLGIISTNAFYQFGTPKRRRITRFVTGGYDPRVPQRERERDEHRGGANYWLSDTLGLRLGIRHTYP